MVDLATDMRLEARRRKLDPVQGFAALACAILALMATAAGLQALIGRVPTPHAFRQAAGVAHACLMVLVLALTVVQIVLRKGTRLHRRLGYAWGGGLILASLISFGMHEINGGFSPPHAFAIATLALVPLIGWLGHTRRRNAHRIVTVSYVLFFLVFAGALTFLPGRAIATLFWSIWR